MTLGDSPSNSSPFAKSPRGRGVVWMRRIANGGFAIAALYFAYLVGILVVSAMNNSEFEGQKLGPVEIENVAMTEKTPLWSEGVARKQVVVLWATWCGPCHSLLMDLKEEVAHGALKAENVVAVSLAEPATDVAAYLAKTPLPFRVALDRDGALARRLKVSGTPTVMFLDENGVIRMVSTGGLGLSGKIARFLQ